MRETGIVVSKDGRLVKVLMVKSEKCKECTACSAFGENSMQLEARNDFGAEVGEIVDVEISPKQVVGFSFLVFIFPVMAMIVGYFLGMRIGGELGMTGEGSGILGAFILLVISFLLIKAYDTLWGRMSKSSAYVVGRSQLIKEDSATFHNLVQ